MAELQGVQVIAPIVPKTTEDEYPVAFANHIAGGYHTADTLTDRDDIPVARREVGMKCLVHSEQKTYILRGGIANFNWVIDTNNTITDNEGVLICDLLDTGISTFKLLFDYPAVISIAASHNVDLSGVTYQVGSTGLESTFSNTLNIPANTLLLIHAEATGLHGVISLRVLPN